MSEYYGVVREGQDDHLEHLFGFGKKGSQKKNHKYLARIQSGKGWRYIYDAAELAAYKAGGAAKKAGSAIGKTADSAYARVQSATNSKVREAEKKYTDSKRMYRSSKGVYKDMVDRAEKDRRLSKRIGEPRDNDYNVDHTRMGKHMGERYREMKSAEAAYNKARKDASPASAVKRGIGKASKAIDKLTGKAQKAELKKDAKKAAINMNRAYELEKRAEKASPGRAYALRTKVGIADQNYRDVRNKYNYRTSGKNNYTDFLNQLYDENINMSNRARSSKKKKKK